MQHYQEFALSLAKEAGTIIKTNFELGMKKEWKLDNTPLTTTDTTINNLVIQAVKQQYPKHSVIAEEGSFVVEGSDFSWVCDPVDGTIPFSHGIPINTFSLALCQNGQPLLGVIYDPYMNRMFSAYKGKGSYLNEQKIQVSRQSSLEHVCIGIEAWKNAQYDFGELLQHLSTQCHVIKPSSIAYLGALVGAGEFSAVLFPGSSPWDGAAVKIIVEEAGGKMTDLFGQEQCYDKKIRGYIASNGLIHNDLLELIQKMIHQNSCQQKIIIIYCILLM